MLTIYALAIATGMAYSILILALLVGWNRINTFNDLIPQQETKISVIIPVRNEAPNIPGLIKALKLQDYPRVLYEVIFIDDHSTDTTEEIIRLCIKDRPEFSLRQNPGEGKKDALNEGIRHSKGEMIITTDADCQSGQKWISSLASFYEQENADMIIGPVVLNDGPGIFQDLQALEFLSLTGSAGGSTGIKKPILCNGANLAIKKSSIHQSGNHLKKEYASGDDMFMLHYLKKKSGMKISFIKSEHAIVSSGTQPDLRSLWNQRKRWTSKSRGYRDSDTVITSVIVFVTNLSLLVTLILAIMMPELVLVFLVLFCIKVIPDFLFLRKISCFFKKRHLLRLLLPMQILYFLYVSVIGIAGNIGKFRWKDRILR